MNEEYVTAYEYSAEHGEYLGTYEVPKCISSGDVHLPKNMTFTPPPTDVTDGKVPAWDGDKWLEIDDPNKLDRPPMPDDYSTLNGDFIQWMIKRGLWTADDEDKYQSDKANSNDISKPTKGEAIE